MLRESVGLLDVSAWGKLTLKGTHADTIVSAHFRKVPTKSGNVIETEPDHILIAKITMDEFLILTAPGSERELLDVWEAEIEFKKSSLA